MATILVIVIVAVASAVAGALATRVLLRSSRTRLAEAALDLLPSGAVVVDRRDTVVLCNAAGRGMGLLRGDELALNELRELVADARREGTVQDAEIRLLHGWLPRDPVAVRARVAPLGKRGHIGMIVEDVTDARRVENMRRDFVANVSHELKTPVGALSLLAEALGEAPDDADAVRRFSARMRHESTRLARLIGELIELSRLETAERGAERAPVVVASLAGEALDRMRPAALARDVRVELDCEPDLRVHGERRQLITALSNLVDNAIAYSPEHSVVHVRAHRRGDEVLLTVTDQGVGIAEDDLDRIFERFYRVDQARSRETGGTGLGLAIVKHTAANHGGRVEVTSSLGRGSTFTLALPAGTGAPARPRAGATR